MLFGLPTRDPFDNYFMHHHLVNSHIYNKLEGVASFCQSSPNSSQMTHQLTSNQMDSEQSITNARHHIMSSGKIPGTLTRKHLISTIVIIIIIIII